MNPYQELKKKHEQDINDFPLVFAFSDAQFKEAMKKLGLGPETNYADKVFKTVGGGFYLKTDAPKFRKMFSDHREEMEEARKDPIFLYHMFDYELANHEYCITGDATDALEALGVTLDDLEKNPEMNEQLTKAMRVQYDYSC